MAKKNKKDLPTPVDVTLQEAQQVTVSALEIRHLQVRQSPDGEKYSVFGQTNLGRVLLVSEAEFAGSGAEDFVTSMFTLLEAQVTADSIRRSE